MFASNSSESPASSNLQWQLIRIDTGDRAVPFAVLLWLIFTRTIATATRNRQIWVSLSCRWIFTCATPSRRVVVVCIDMLTTNDGDVSAVCGAKWALGKPVGWRIWEWKLLLTIGITRFPPIGGGDVVFACEDAIMQTLLVLVLNGTFFWKKYTILFTKCRAKAFFFNLYIVFVSY